MLQAPLYCIQGFRFSFHIDILVPPSNACRLILYILKADESFTWNRRWGTSFRFSLGNYAFCLVLNQITFMCLEVADSTFYQVKEALQNGKMLSSFILCKIFSDVSSNLILAWSIRFQIHFFLSGC